MVDALWYPVWDSGIGLGHALRSIGGFLELADADLDTATSLFSLRHLAEAYRAHGFVAIGIRMPGHGTVPAGLTAAVWEDWMAATRLAMREARRRAGP